MLEFYTVQISVFFSKKNQIEPQSSFFNAQFKTAFYKIHDKNLNFPINA